MTINTLTRPTSHQTASAEPVSILPLRDRAGLMPADAAVFLGVGYSTLKKWRAEGTGPRYAKIGGSVLYRPSDLDAFVESRLVA